MLAAAELNAAWPAQKQDSPRPSEKGEPTNLPHNSHYQYLREEIDQIPAISAHDHLCPEKQAVAMKTDLFDVLFSGLVWVDLVSAGYRLQPGDTFFGLEPEGDKRPRDGDLAWSRVKPRLDNVQDTAVFQVRMRGLRELFDFQEELSDSNWRVLNERVMAAQQPGRYFDVLRKRQNLEATLLDRPNTWAGTDAADRFYSVNVMKVLPWTNLAQFALKTSGLGVGPLETLDQTVEALEVYVARLMKEGVIALKMLHAYTRTIEFDDVPKEVAEKDFPKPDDSGPIPKTVQDYMAGQICRLAAEYDVPVAFHTGYQLGNDNDIRNSRAQLLCSLIHRHPNTRFDLFHTGYPYADETMLLAKYFPNVTFNMSFGVHLSPTKMVELLHVALELMPTNKILAYGCDEFILEGHVGATAIWRDCIARCLAERIEDGKLTRPRALRLMRKLVRDNAAEAYRYDRWRAQHPAD